MGHAAATSDRASLRTRPDFTRSTRNGLALDLGLYRESRPRRDRPFLLKTSPSGGARHPIEAYVAAMRVENLEAGIYHYNVEHDALDRIGAAVSGDEAATLFAHQPWVRDAAALFFMTAVVTRSIWKYKHSHAYRVLLLDAGHLGQTFHLACAGAGLAPFTSSAKDDPAIERLLGIDGVGEISLYAAATGLAAAHRQSTRARQKLGVSAP